MTNILQLQQKMIAYYAGDARRIQHFIKVHSFSRLIGQAEGLDDKTQNILEMAALVHDIGIREGERLYGRHDGKIQEKIGPQIAREMLSEMKLELDIIDRICYLVGHHHTYINIDGLDYQILVEADFLVNLYEDDSSQAAAQAAYKNIFKTKTGKALIQTMFKGAEDE